MKYAVKLEDGSYLVKRVHPANPSEILLIALVNALCADDLSPWLLSKGKAFAMASHIFGARVIPWNPPKTFPRVWRD